MPLRPVAEEDRIEERLSHAAGSLNVFSLQSTPALTDTKAPEQRFTPQKKTILVKILQTLWSESLCPRTVPLCMFCA